MFTEKSSYNGGLTKNQYVGEECLGGRGGRWEVWTVCRFKWELGKKVGVVFFQRISDLIENNPGQLGDD